jgi:hypothetical protein
MNSTEGYESETNELTVEDLDAVVGGIKKTDVIMPYKDFTTWPGGDPSPGRLA